MSEHEHLDLAALRRLSDRLGLAPRVQKIAKERSELAVDIATEAASALLQIDRACHVLSRLNAELIDLPPNSAEFASTLDDIAEEFRLLHYQIVNARLFNYVVPH